MDLTLAQKAISSALSSSWKEAKDLNLEILKSSPDDVDALNRLARSYAELGDMENAKKTSKKVLSIDPANNIALKCLEKWNVLNDSDKHVSYQISAEAFLEEPGKTKLVPLLNLGESRTLAKLDSGDEVNISAHAHRVSVMTKDNKYVGRLPDDISAKLRQLIKLGNEYYALIKSIDEHDVKVFLREIKKGPKAKTLSSFSTEKLDYVSFTPPELVHKIEENVLQDESEETEVI